MNWWKLTILASLNVFLVACNSVPKTINADPNANRAAPSLTATNSKTRELFTKDCSICHQPSGEGGTVKLEDNTKLKVPSLKSDKAIRHSDQDYTSQILKGGDGMPAFKDKLKEEEIKDLIRFIREQIQVK